MLGELGVVDGCLGHGVEEQNGSGRATTPVPP